MQNSITLFDFPRLVKVHCTLDLHGFPNDISWLMDLINCVKLSLIIVFSSVYLISFVENFESSFLHNFDLILRLSIVNLNKTNFSSVDSTLKSSNTYDNDFFS